MKKYMEVFRTSFKMRIVWRFDVVMTMVATVARILAAWILWRAVFEGKGSVGGFTFEAMLSYYIVCSIIGSVDFSDKISAEVSWLIRDGEFSKHMAAPMEPIGFFGAMAGGESAFHLGFSILAAAVCAGLFGVNIVFAGDIMRMMLAAVMIPVGLAFMVMYHYLIGITAFKFLDINFFLHVQESIVAFATGSLVPLSLLPDAVTGALRFLPFTHVIYTPSMLLTGQLSAAEGILGLGVISAWTLAMTVIARRSYNSLRVKYDGVGI